MLNLNLLNLEYSTKLNLKILYVLASQIHIILNEYFTRYKFVGLASNMKNVWEYYENYVSKKFNLFFVKIIFF